MFHDWLEDRADRIETREMHDRRRYWVTGNTNAAAAATSLAASDGGVQSEPSPASDLTGEGMVEIVDQSKTQTSVRTAIGFASRTMATSKGV